MFQSCSNYKRDIELDMCNIQFVNQTLRRRRNQLTIYYNLLATLPEKLSENLDIKQLKQLDKIIILITAFTKGESSEAVVTTQYQSCQYR